MWVESAGNKASVESKVCLLREQMNSYEADTELLTVREMLDRKWPATKVNGVIRAGGGILDEHAPEDLSLVAYWVKTSRKKREVDLSKTSASMQLTGEASASAVHELMRTNEGPLPAGTPAVGPDVVLALQSSLHPETLFQGAWLRYLLYVLFIHVFSFFCFRYRAESCRAAGGQG